MPWVPGHWCIVVAVVQACTCHAASFLLCFLCPYHFLLCGTRERTSSRVSPAALATIVVTHGRKAVGHVSTIA
jgi:hypothetical protein